jgi:hypothetical protein
MQLTISVDIARVTFGLLLLAASCLSFVGFVAQSYTYLPEDWGLRGTLSTLDPGGDGVRVLDANAEGSVPAWFSSSLLLVCALLAFSLAVRDWEHTARYAGHWRVLAIVLLFMSLDEAVSLHERTIEPLRSALNTSGPFYYAWVIPGTAFVLAFVLAYRRFLLDLPPNKSRRLFAAAGTLYVCGALVMEMVGGAYVDSYGDANIAILTIIAVEEYLEMLGATTLLYALMLLADSR